LQNSIPTLGRLDICPIVQIKQKDSHSDIEFTPRPGVELFRTANITGITRPLRETQKFMDSAQQLSFKVFHGPNLIVPFAAVIAEFKTSFSHPLPADTIKQFLSELARYPLHVSFTSEEVEFAYLVSELAMALQDLRGPSGLPARVDRLDGQVFRVSIGFFDMEVAASALQAGYGLAASVYARSAGGVVNTARINTLLKRVATLGLNHQPDKITRHMIRVARKHDIPVCQFSPGSNVWMYGHGAASYRFIRSVCQDESLIGVHLVRDKVHTHRLMHRLGFPSLEFGVVDTPHLAREVARQIGYPVVAKPTDSEGGLGVTVAIASDQELDTAFAFARSKSRIGMVQIEKFIHGDQHRLSVFGGKFKRATQLSAAHIVGDGVSTVEQLIKAENKRRIDEDAAVQSVLQLEIDSAMIEMLAKQGYGLNDSPPQNVRLQLRQISNIKAGGKLRDVTNLIHPDNIKMAEAIARILSLDGAGIDFITPDISICWRDIKCAILEVNSPPGLSTDYLAEKVILEKFPPGRNGRVPSILVIGEQLDLLNRIVERIQSAGLQVGRTDSSGTSIAGEQRFDRQPEWPARILALVLDPACEVLVTACSTGDVATYGLPHVRFDVALVAELDSVPEHIREFLRISVGQVIEPETTSTIDPHAWPAIAALVGRKERACTQR